MTVVLKMMMLMMIMRRRMMRTRMRMIGMGMRMMRRRQRMRMRQGMDIANHDESFDDCAIGGTLERTPGRGGGRGWVGGRCP